MSEKAFNKSNIVLINHWANVFHPSAKQGATPETFVTWYMPRFEATEALMFNPIKDPVLLARKMHWIHRNLTPKERSKRLLKHYKLSGRAFDNDSLSCSDNKIHKDGRLIQNCFNQGHSVDKMVISFRSGYLKRKKIADPNFHMYGQGSGFGHIDEFKMRSSIRNSINSYAKEAHYVNPKYLGTIQFDTDNIHCHLVLTDDCPMKQSQRLVPYKEQHSDFPYDHHLEDRGKMDPRQMKDLMQGIDFNFSLQRNAEPTFYHDVTREDTLEDGIWAVTSQEENSNVILQELVASLPKNRFLWHYDSKSHLMHRPKELMRSYIGSLIHNYGNEIGYSHSVDVINHESRRFASKQHPQKELKKRGEHNLHVRMADDVFTMLNDSVKKGQLSIRTNFIRDRACDVKELQSKVKAMYHGKYSKHDEDILMAYRTHSYRYRYLYHNYELHRNERSLNQFDDPQTNQMISPSAQSMVRPYYLQNKLYHAQVMDKYRRSLYITPRDGRLNRKLQRQRKPFMNEYQHFLKAPHSIHNTSHFSSVDALLGDPDTNMQHTLDFPVDKSGRTSLRQQLIHYKHYPSEGMTSRASWMLDQISTQVPKYKNVTKEIKAAKNQRPQVTFTNSKDKADYDKYVLRLGRYTDHCFDAGIVNSNQLVDVQDAQKHPIVRPPKLHERNAVNRYTYNKVKGVDMDDCTLDFQPHQSRYINDTTADDYDRSTKKRYKAAQKAKKFIILSSQQQRAAVVRNIDKELHLMALKKKRKLAKKMKRTHQLPIANVSDTYINEDRKRNISTWNLKSARHYTYEHVKSLGQVDNDYATEISHDPSIMISGYNRQSEANNEITPS